jgi:hypothetical protein
LIRWCNVENRRDWFSRDTTASLCICAIVHCLQLSEVLLSETLLMWSSLRLSRLAALWFGNDHNAGCHSPIFPLSWLAIQSNRLRFSLIVLILSRCSESKRTRISEKHHCTITPEGVLRYFRCSGLHFLGMATVGSRRLRIQAMPCFDMHGLLSLHLPSLYSVSVISHSCEANCCACQVPCGWFYDHLGVSQPENT